jgi:hypothetical protein
MASSPDALRAVVSDVQRWSADRGVPIIKGLLPERDYEVPVVEYAAPDSSATPEFLETIARLGKIAIVLDWDELAMHEVEEVELIARDRQARDDNVEDDDDDFPAEGDNDEFDAEDVQERLATARASIGQVKRVDVVVFTEWPSLIVNWTLVAEWASVVDELHQMAESSSDDDYGATMRDERLAAREAQQAVMDRFHATWSDDRIREVALMLARAPGFQSAIGATQSRRLLADREVKKESTEGVYPITVTQLVSRIAEEARLLYLDVVIPEREAPMIARAQAMLAEGIPKRRVAENLGLTPQRLTQLLLKYSKDGSTP